MAKRRRPKPAGSMAEFKPPTLRERVKDHADSAVRTVMEQHPLVQKMRSDMTKAIMSVAKGSARGPAARGRQRSVFS